MGAQATAAQSRLVDMFDRSGFARVETEILQPAELFLDLSGEDMRRRMFLTQDGFGRELCLRPEHTIPVCRAHVAAGRSGPAEYSYLGPVFRLRPDESGEFLQAGIESIGRRDTAAADAQVIALALEGLALLGTAPSRVRLGDMGLLQALLHALAVPAAVRRRLTRALAAGRSIADILEPNGGAVPEGHAGLLAAIEGQDRGAARLFVEDLLSIAGIVPVGGRSAGEIAERFLSRAANRSGALPQETRAVLARYLAISADPDSASRAVGALAADAGLDIGRALDLFEERNGFMAARGLGIHAFVFGADFARNLDYYTGFIFEMQSAGRTDGKPVVGGGRYDGLLGHLGAPADIPAVGCAFWLDRLPQEPAR
jgi:ATP phosphoribosyltransferase regulatory subunit